MSSPLDGRIRHIAREVLAEAGHPTPDDATSGTPAGGEDRLAQLEEQVATLTGRVDELEKRSAAAPARRGARKTTDADE